MKATEFCKFFDFTLYRESGIDEDGNEYNYIAVDDQGCWDDRTGSKITDITDWFDACLQDYVEEPIEYAGFEPKSEGKRYWNYYEQALAWCDANEDYKDTDLRNIIACLLNPELIEDDTEVENEVV